MAAPPARSRTARHEKACSSAASAARPTATSDGSSTEMASSGSSAHVSSPDSTRSAAATAWAWRPSAARWAAIVVGSHASQSDSSLRGSSTQAA